MRGFAVAERPHWSRVYDPACNVLHPGTVISIFGHRGSRSAERPPALGQSWKVSTRITLATSRTIGCESSRSTVLLSAESGAG